MTVREAGDVALGLATLALIEVTGFIIYLYDPRFARRGGLRPTGGWTS